MTSGLPSGEFCRWSRGWRRVCTRARARPAPRSRTTAVFLSLFLHTPFSPPPLPTHSAAHPTWGIGEIGKELGQQWKKVTDAEKVKYAASAEKDKVRYQKELAAYNKSA
jgi:hypothetical protein